MNRPDPLVLPRTLRGTLCTTAIALMLGSAVAAVPDPVVKELPFTVSPGQPSRDYIFFSSNHDLARRGYVEEEFVIEGTAGRYSTPANATGALLDDGHPYRTRMVVRRPANPTWFNGTVLVEWYNVTNGFDADNVWFFTWDHLMRAGYAWVGVSAQAVGVDRLKTWSPTRYGALDVTRGGTVAADGLSYDIFSQAGQAVSRPQGIDPLRGLVPQRVIAIGESASARALSTYVNSIQPLANVYDGFFLLSTLGNAVRADLDVPVFKVLTEWDVTTQEAAVRQVDTDRFVTWEIAGTSHVDKYLRASREPLELRDLGVSSEATLAPQCTVTNIGTSVPMHYVLASALDRLGSWVDRGTPPPSAPRIAIATLGSTGVPSVPAKDGFGHVLGGIRLSEFDVPTEYNVGTNAGPGACGRWGYSQPFDVAVLRELYPSHGEYVARVRSVNAANVAAGFILRRDAQTSNMTAAGSRVGADAGVSGRAGEDSRHPGDIGAGP